MHHIRKAGPEADLSHNLFYDIALVATIMAFVEIFFDRGSSSLKVSSLLTCLFSQWRSEVRLCAVRWM